MVLVQGCNGSDLCFVNKKMSQTLTALKGPGLSEGCVFIKLSSSLIVLQNKCLQPVTRRITELDGFWKELILTDFQHPWPSSH